MTTLDPVDYAVISQALMATAREMGSKLCRSAYSSIVREVKDASAGILDARGQAVAQSDQLTPVLVGSLSHTFRPCAERYPIEALVEGDFYINNHPYMGGQHSPDIFIFMPIFFAGQLVGFSASVAHHLDIGGGAPGINNLATDYYQEGLIIPPSRYNMERDWQEGPLADLIQANVRVPDQTIGDLNAQFAANRIGAHRVQELCQKYDAKRVGAAMDGLIEYCERRVRTAISEIPDGVYRGEDAVDDNGIDEQPLWVRVALTVAGDTLTVDYAGTCEQVVPNLNSPLASTKSATLACLKMILTGDDVPFNEGANRAIRVEVPLGSLLNPRPPAPCTTRAMAGQLLPPCVMGALAEAIPEQVLAQPGSPTCCFNVSGVHDARAYALISFVSGGMGAGAGWNGLAPMSFPSNVANSPMEVMEEQAPIRIVTREMREGSGGKGRHRGGNGQRIVFDMIGDSPATASFLMNRVDRPALGLNGGKPGATGRVRINGREINPADHQVLKPGDRVIMETPAGGGFGRPEPARSGR